MADTLNPAKLNTGYRTAFHFKLREGKRARDVAEGYVRDWLGTRYRDREDCQRDGQAIDAWDGRSYIELPVKGTAVHGTAYEDGRSGDCAVIFRITDVNAQGRFRVTIAAYDSLNNGSGNASFVVEVAQSNGTVEDAIDEIRTPKIVKNILGERDVYDSTVMLSGKPSMLRRDDSQNLVDALSDSQRQGAIIIASSPDPKADDLWLSAVEQLTRNSVGVAAVFVLAAEAVEGFNDLVPEHLQVRRGTVRTFLPGVSFDDENDGLRHRFVGPATIAEAISTGADQKIRVSSVLANVNGRIPRKLLLERPLSSKTRRILNLLYKAERRERIELDVVERAKQAKPVGSNEPPAASITAEREKGDLDKPAMPRHKDDGSDQDRPPAARNVGLKLWRIAKGLITKWLDDDNTEIDEHSLERLDKQITSERKELSVHKEYLEEVEQENEDVQGSLAALQTELDDVRLDAASYQAELEDALSQNDKYSRQLIFYRQRLEKFEDHETVGAEEYSDQRWNYPADLDDFLTGLKEKGDYSFVTEYVSFTHNEKMVRDLSRSDPAGVYAKTVWDAVHTLYDYALAKSEGEDVPSVDAYLTSTMVPGFRLSRKRHASHESDTVCNNARLKRERVFSVPASVDPAGKTFMEAHFKIATGDSVAPRLYYYDNTNEDGKIYVGYIGRHLTNTKTN